MYCVEFVSWSGDGVGRERGKGRGTEDFYFEIGGRVNADFKKMFFLLVVTDLLESQVRVTALSTLHVVFKLQAAQSPQ